MTDEVSCETGEERAARHDRERVVALEAAIKEHRAQKADDRCVEDDDRLYEVLGDGIKCDRRVGSKEEMLKNCARFIDRRCEAGAWPNYSDLEKEVHRLKALLLRLTPFSWCNHGCPARNAGPCSCGYRPLLIEVGNVLEGVRP